MRFELRYSGVVLFSRFRTFSRASVSDSGSEARIALSWTLPCNVDQHSKGTRKFSGFVSVKLKFEAQLKNKSKHVGVRAVISVEQDFIPKSSLLKTYVERSRFHIIRDSIDQRPIISCYLINYIELEVVNSKTINTKS